MTPLELRILQLLHRYERGVFSTYFFPKEESQVRAREDFSMFDTQRIKKTIAKLRHEGVVEVGADRDATLTLRAGQTCRAHDDCKFNFELALACVAARSQESPKKPAR